MSENQVSVGERVEHIKGEAIDRMIGYVMPVTLGDYSYVSILIPMSREAQDVTLKQLTDGI